MWRRGIGIVALVWGALLTQGTAALAITSINPVTINDCRISNTRSYVSAYKPIVLVFTNRRAVPADEVRFTVEYGGRTEHVSDRGTFSQNVRIEHAFSGFYNVRYGSPPPNCTVDYVEFRDGTVWTPTPPSPAPACEGE